MHSFPTTLLYPISGKIQGRTIQFIHKSRSSQSTHNTVDKGEKIHNLLFSKTNLTPWQQNGPVHQGDYHLLQSNLLLGSGTCQQVFEGVRDLPVLAATSGRNFSSAIDYL